MQDLKGVQPSLSRARPLPASNASTAGGLNSPYGGKLVDLIVSDERAAEMKATAKDCCRAHSR